MFLIRYKSDPKVYFNASRESWCPRKDATLYENERAAQSDCHTVIDGVVVDEAKAAPKPAKPASKPYVEPEGVAKQKPSSK